LGKNNQIEINNSKICNTNITIKGYDNKLTFEDGFDIRKANIILYGINCSICIGRNTIINGIRIVNVGKNNNIEIGQNCLFADNVEIYGSDTHSIYNKNGDFINPECSVIICSKVWIGVHVKILKGVHIGEGAIVGIGSLVTKNVAANCLVAGNPIRLLKEDIKWTLDYESTKEAGLSIYD
jgi:acetyltransferase-like isoleucine patch superfamily enzyme